ncbi:MAG: Gfo/Idh/MocA family oxidoreductase [Microcella sp.]|nr:MAG: Gfo/Idh/MocA family oxidoreductase [Microcella sp.]
MVGGGFMGKAHAIAYAAMPMYFWPAPAIPVRATLVEATNERAADAAQQLGFAHWSSDWRSVIDDPQIDVVDIVTPNDLHEEMVIAAAQAGKHIICEKPLSLNASSARRMLEAAEAAGITHATAFNFRRIPAVVFARQLIDEGAIGDVLDFRGTYLQDWSADPTFPATWRFDKSRAGSGAIGDIGSHVIDFARYLVGEVRQVHAVSSTYIPERPDPESPAGALLRVDVDDWASIQLEFETGQRGSIEVSRLAHGRNNLLGFEVHGTRGTLVFDYEHRDQLKVALADDGARMSGFRTINTGPAHPYGHALWPGPALGNGYAESKIIECFEFFTALTEGRPADPSFVDGYRTAAIVDAIIASTEARAWVEVDSS